MFLGFLQGWPTRAVAEWPLGSPQPTANLTAEPTNFPLATPSTPPGAPQGQTTKIPPASTSQRLPECGEGEGHSKSPLLPTTTSCGEGEVAVDNSDVGCREESFSAYFDTLDNVVFGQNEQDILDDDATPCNHHNPKGLVNRSESCGSFTGVLYIAHAIC